MRLKELREENGLSQQRLGEILGVTSVTICNWETGKIPIKYWRKKQLVYILGGTIHDYE